MARASRPAAPLTRASSSTRSPTSLPSDPSSWRSCARSPMRARRCPTTTSSPRSRVRFAAIGVLIHVPRNVALEQPIVVRWAAGEPGRGLDLAHCHQPGRERPGADPRGAARLGRASPPTDEQQSLWWGTSEVRLERGAHLAFAGQQDFGPTPSPSSIATPSLGQDAQLRWALASVGAALHKSRIDNRLVGRGSSVEPGGDRLRQWPASCST